MQLCPHCDELIKSAAVNIEEGIALCPSCGILSRLSELNTSGRTLFETLDLPPDGCVINASGEGVIVTASLRSVSGFLGCTAIALFWNGIVSVFVFVAIAGLYTHFIGPLPDWFPAPEFNEGGPGVEGQPMGLGMVLFLCIFLIPFVVVGLGMIVAALLNLIGKVEVVIDDQKSWVATCISSFKWKRRFDPLMVRTIKCVNSRWQSHDGTTDKIIELAADRTIKFGSMLESDRMEWIRMALNEIFLRGDREPIHPDIPKMSWLQQRG